MIAGLFFRDAAAVDDLSDLDAIRFNAVDDGECAKSGGLDERAVDFRGAGVERLPHQQAGQALVRQDGAVAVVPVQRHQPAFAGL